SAWMFSRASDAMRSVTEMGTPLLKVSCEMSPVHCWRVRRRPSLTAAPNLAECEPVTYETDADSVNSFEKWSAGLFHAFVVQPVGLRAAHAPVWAVFSLVVEVGRYLVLRAHLNRHARRDAPDVAVVDAGPGLICDIPGEHAGHGRWVCVGEGISHGFVGAEV